MVSKTKLTYKFIKAGLYRYNDLRIRKVRLGGYYLSHYYNKNPFSRDGYCPTILYWTISRNNIILDTALILEHAKQRAKKINESYTKLSS